MQNQDVFQLTSDYIMPTYARFPVAIERGQGATLWDFDGKQYIDFTSGIGVCSVGHANPAWVAAVAAQAGQLAHISNLYYTGPGAQLAQQLCTRSGMKKAFFANSGAEANEAAIKLARKYSFDKYGRGRHTIVTLEQSFHGRTVTTLAATGQEVFHNWFFPFTEGFRYTPANDCAALEAALTSDVCALMIELVQGEGGVLPLDSAFVAEAARLCQARDILLLVDEVQTGVGRTGSLFAFQHYQLLPDVVSFAKGLAGGLPFGGILAAAQVENVLSAGMHATTFGGNPICSAAALAVLEILSPEALQQVEEKGAYLRSRIEAMQLPCVEAIRGLGLMLGVKVKGSHKAYVERMAEAGLLALTAGSDAIRLLPPLTISAAEIDAGLTIFEAVLRQQG